MGLTPIKLNDPTRGLQRYQNQRGLSYNQSLETVTVTGSPLQIDNLAYTYASGNQLSKVADASGNTAGFNDGANTTTEYNYGTLGNLTADQNKGISGVTYNILGKPQQVTFTSGTTVAYTYDATGAKLRAATTVSGVTTTTDYVNGFVYTNNAISFFSSPEGRVAKNATGYEYQYAITDHQGNTRVLFTSAPQTAISVTATFESAVQTTEATKFLNYPTGSHLNGVATNAHTGTYSEYLNGAASGGQVGVANNYTVMPGDKLQITAYAKYYAPSQTASNLVGFAAALLGAFNLPAPGQGELGTPSAGINTFGSMEAGAFGDGTKDNTDPKAFATILIFDKNYNFLDVAYSQLTSSGTMTANYTVKEAGYAYMYISNEQQFQTDIYFDDVTMGYTPSPILQQNEYYPFGLQTTNSWTRTGTVANEFLGNGGTELNPVTGVYDLDFRNYDPALGRMNQVDPMAHKYASHTPYNYSFNSPVVMNDVNGADPLPTGGCGEYNQINDKYSTYYENMMAQGAFRPAATTQYNNNYGGGYSTLSTMFLAPSQWDENQDLISNYWEFGGGTRDGYSSLSQTQIKQTGGYWARFTHYYQTTTGIKDEKGNWMLEGLSVVNSSESEYYYVDDLTQGGREITGADITALSNQFGKFTNGQQVLNFINSFINANPNAYVKGSTLSKSVRNITDQARDALKGINAATLSDNQIAISTIDAEKIKINIFPGLNLKISDGATFDISTLGPNQAVIDVSGVKVGLFNFNQVVINPGSVTINIAGVSKTFDLNK